MRCRSSFLLTTLLLSWLVSVVSAQQSQNKEVLFFYIPGYSSENGDGWRFLDLESDELSFWYAGPEILGASISPDGTQVAYSQGDSIFISDIERQTITPLVTGLADNLSGNPRTPTWSPTGDRIAYYFNHTDRTKVELKIVDLAGNQLASHEVYNTVQPPPTWSPDGTKVVCISDGANGLGTAICVVDVASGIASRIYEPVNTISETGTTTKSVMTPVWEPNGDRIAFVLRTAVNLTGTPWVDSEAANIAVVSSNGVGFREVTDFPTKAEGRGIGQLAWSPNGTEIAYSSNDSSSEPTRGIYRVPVAGGTEQLILADEANIIYAFQWVNLNPAPSFEIKLDPDKNIFDVGDSLEVRFEVKNRGASSATYTFAGGLFNQEPELEEGEEPIVEFAEFETPEPFVLSSEDSERVFTIQATAMKSGAVTLLSSITVAPDEGESYTLDAEQALTVSPVTTQITITNKRHQWKKTEEADWGERAKAINAQRRDAGEAPYENLIELEVQVTNNSDSNIENLNIPDARDILSYISSADISDPSVPLKPIRLFNADETEVDLTNPEDDTEVNNIILPPEQTATFAWVVEAFQIDPEQRDEPYELEFKPLILGSVAGVNLQIGKTEPFSIRVRDAIIVNVTSDDQDADPEDGVIDVDLDEEGEQISLRAAIEYANETPGLDRIEFDIPGSGTPTIEIGLPPEGTNIMATGSGDSIFPHPVSSDGISTPEQFTIVSSLKSTGPIEIDGTTQPGGWVELTSSFKGFIGPPNYADYNLAVHSEPKHLEGLNGLEISGGNSEIRGLVINDFRGIGLVITSKGDNWIAGNRIGTDPTGTQSIPNINGNPIYTEETGFYSTEVFYGGGLLVTTSDNLIGGTSAEDGNLISSLTCYRDNPHSYYGGELTIAGSEANRNRVVGNYIGTDASGESHPTAPTFIASNLTIIGILIKNNASFNTIGGSTSSERNIVNGDLLIGNETQGTTVTGNYFGVGVAGGQTFKEFTRHGVWVSGAKNVVFADNVVKGDANSAIRITESENISLTGNSVGVLPNGDRMAYPSIKQIYVEDSKDVTIGGFHSDDENILGLTDVNFYTGSPDDNLNVQYLGNQIAGMQEPGESYMIIDHRLDGVDEQDYGDQDGRQNYPRITAVSKEGNNIRFGGLLESHLGGDNYYLDFYKIKTPFPSGHGGTPISYVGRSSVETDLSGLGQFDIVFPYSDLEESDYFAATATRMNEGHTSELSANRQLNSSFLKDLNREAYGDRNQDGTDDVDQDNVESFSAANGADTTIEVSAAANNSSDFQLPFIQSDFGTRDDANPTLENVIPETQASMNAPSNYYYSNGLLTFEVPDLSAGASVSVKLILANDATPDSLWALQSDHTWTENLPATFDGNQVTLILTDGGAGDSDGEANGTIVATLGAATALPPIPDMEFTITKDRFTHTLSWPIPYSGAILEFSRDLSTDSWRAIESPNIVRTTDHWQLTLSNPQTEVLPNLPEDLTESGFYRLRYQAQSESRIPYHTWLRAQLENEYGITGGEWITGATESQAMDTLFVDEDVTRTDFAAEDQPFVRAINLRNAVVPPNNWNDFAFFRSQDTITTGDVLLVVIWVRGKDIGEGLPTIRHNFEITESPFTKIYSQQVVTSDAWTQYLIPMEATFDMPDTWYTMHMGFAVQEVEIGGVAVLNYGNTYLVDQLPKLNVP